MRLVAERAHHDRDVNGGNVPGAPDRRLIGNGPLPSESAPALSTMPAPCLDGGTRTPDLVVPNHARYLLRYTQVPGRRPRSTLGVKVTVTTPDRPSPRNRTLHRLLIREPRATSDARWWSRKATASGCRNTVPTGDVGLERETGVEPA